MNNDDANLNKSSNHFDFSMQNMNQSLMDNDDTCIELLDMISMDDNSSTILNDQSNINSDVLLDVGESKEDDRFCQEILSALDKKDFQLVATLALSQSQGGRKMGVILNETMLAIEKSSNKTMDSNIIEKLTNIIRAQPKNSSSVLRATVAPIRNESVVSTSSPSIANYSLVPNNPSSKSGSHLSRVSTSQEFSEYELQALFSPETKSQGSRSLPATPPVPQVPSRPLSSSCLPQKSGDAWRLDIDQGYSYQAPPGMNAPMPFMQFNNQPGSMMLQNGGYSQVAHNTQYQPSFIANNGIVCIVTPSLPGEVPQTMYSGNMTQNPFLMPQNMLMSLSNNSNSPCQSLSSTCAMSTFAMSESPKTSIVNSVNHANNLPKLLPKPSNRIIAPKTQYSTQQFVSQPPQQFKRPTVNKRNNVKPKSSGSKSNRASKDKDNIRKAWEIADQSCEDQQAQSFIAQLEAPVHDFSMMLSRPFDEDSYDSNIERLNIFSNLEDMFESKQESFECVTFIFSYCTIEVCYEEVITYCQAFTFSVAPLFQATLSSTPKLHSALVIISKPLTIVSDDASWPPSSNNSRMVQLLCAHFGRHSGLLSPLLKCLLPQSSENHPDLSTGPLSVSTEQEDLMIEEDLLADISPVKRDPTHLANLDRLLESCQPPSSDVSTCSSSNILHTRLPFQLTEDCLTLDHVINSPIMSWLKRGKHKNKWTVNNKIVPSTRSIEVPYVTEKLSPTFLRKKSNYRDNKFFGHSTIINENKSDKYRLRMENILHVNRMRREEVLSPIKPVSVYQPSTGLLKIRIQLPKNNIIETPLKPLAIKLDNVTNYKTDQARNNDQFNTMTKVKLELTAPPKLKIDLSKTFLENNGSKIKDNTFINDNLKPLSINVNSVVNSSFNIDCIDPLSIKIDSNLSKQSNSPKKSQSRRSRKKKSRNNLKQLPCLSKQINKSGYNTKRIFCTRKEDRRSSVLHTQVINSSPTKTRHSPTKKKRNKIVTENPPLIMKLCSKKTEAVLPVDQEQETEELPITSDRIKLLIKRNGQCSYQSQISSVLPVTVSDNVSEEENYQYSSEVNLAPPSQLRSRPQQAVLQFSPTHSSSDSDEVGVAHNEISSLLQRQEQREPLSNTVAASGSIINQTTFPSLPVPYLIGCDPTVFMDPHEVELVVVKNSRYKKISQVENVDNQTIATTVPVNIFSSDTTNNEIFVPGCFIEQDKTVNTWNRSSPSMPVLAPQEPFATAVDASKSALIIHPCGYSQPSQQSQPFSDPPDHVQQSPLCMATTNTHNSQFSSSSQIDLMSSDPIKSPYRHSSYHYQPTYNSSCYIGDSSNQAMIPPPQAPSSSKSQMQSPPVPLQTNASSACSSHLTDYSYFHNPSQQSLQSLVSAETSLFPVPSSSYQSISEPQPIKSSSKRSSSSRNNQSCDNSSSSSKKRKESSSLSSLSMYPNNTDLYTAATNYPGLDYYSTGFSNILNLDHVKLYEQYAREYSLQFGNFCPPNTSWSNAMAEYCKQAQVLNPQSSSISPNIIPGGLPSVNPLSNLQATDYSNPYSAYAMSQPYTTMYSTFGVPK